MIAKIANELLREAFLKKNYVVYRKLSSVNGTVDSEERERVCGTVRIPGVGNRGRSAKTFPVYSLVLCVTVGRKTFLNPNISKFLGVG